MPADDRGNRARRAPKSPGTRSTYDRYRLAASAAFSTTSLALLAAASMLGLLRRIPPRWSARLILVVSGAGLLFRFFLGTAFGLLVVTIGLYVAMSQFGSTKPLTVAQLALWLDELPLESRAAVVTALLTIIGFLVAFHAASVGWRNESVAHRKARIADEIADFYSELARHIVSARIYVQSLVDAVDFLQKNGPTPEADFRVRHVLQSTEAFVAVRDRLSAMSVEVHRITGQHHSLLSTVWGALESLRDCEDALQRVARAMWVRIPIIQPNYPDPFAQFLAQVNVAECLRFLQVCDRSYDFINTLTGGVRGVLLAPLAGFNLAAFSDLLRNRRILHKALGVVHEKPEDQG